MRRAVTLLTVFSVFAVVGIAQASSPLTGNIEAWKVTIAEKTGDESFVPAEEALPRDLIEYRLNYEKRGTDALRAISIIDPIPSGTEYVVSTAQQPDGATVTFSIDEGTSYHAWPVQMRKIVDGKEILVDAPADAVTHIRWTLDNELDPAAKVQMAYRTVVQ